MKYGQWPQILFKSDHENWIKEESGAKRMTLRTRTRALDKRFQQLDMWIDEDIARDCEIGIFNNSTKAIFKRKITAVGKFKNVYYICW